MIVSCTMFKVIIKMPQCFEHHQHALKSYSHTVDRKNPAAVEVGSLPHYLQGFMSFIHPNGGWPWDFFDHQPQFIEEIDGPPEISSGASPR